ncbi:MAG TPA: FAD-dependent monooxygenase [Candidatus Acidoferrum sp.]|nr:FAD-dependent monooxygenase [Candidatus Acidoferrum sp.]
MSSPIGKRAIVVGAGMGGLTAAAALADRFEHVLVLERDALPADAVDRSGIPQGRHVHALLAGGLRALGELFPGFEGELAKAGAVTLRMGLDIRTERPGFDPFPQRDLGFDAFAMSRPLLEWLVRGRVRALSNVELRQGVRVDALVPRADGAAIVGVRCDRPGATSETLDADLVVDASGRGNLTLDLLESLGQPRPEETTIGVDLRYATAVFSIPDDAPTDWKGVFCFPRPPRSSRGALLLPLEGRRWIVTLAGRHGEDPPGDADGFMAFARQLRTPTIFNAIEHAKRVGEPVRFGFPESVYRHYERLAVFPRGLLVVADAMCRFNPVYGQGMSVAAQEAVALRRLLSVRSGEADPLDGLALPFFAEAAGLIDTPWFGAAIPDFVHPQTRGTRPDNLEAMLKFGMSLTRLAARDPGVHKLTAEVQNLVKPRSAYLDPELVQRVLALTGGGG